MLFIKKVVALDTGAKQQSKIQHRENFNRQSLVVKFLSFRNYCNKEILAHGSLWERAGVRIRYDSDWAWGISMRKIMSKTLMASGSAVLAVAAGAGSAGAVEIYNQGGTKIESTVELGVGLFHVNEDFSGQNRGSVSWQEGYVIAGFKFEHAMDANWKIFGAFTGVANGNRGQGDALGFSTGTESGGQVQDASGGISWSDGKDGGATVKLSGGRQKWVLGDGFLIAGDQGTDGRGFGEQYNEDGSYYMNPRRVFSQTAILEADTGTPLKFAAFYVESEKAYHGQFGLAGGNLDYVDTKWGTIGLTYLRGVKLDDPQNIFPPPNSEARDGINAYNIHGNSSLGIKDFNLAFTYVKETNNSLTANTIGQTPGFLGANYKLDAWAWYISPSYTFSTMAWTPTLSYRFASFSGDDTKTTGTQEGYDPLFYGATGYNTWFIGEIAANYSGPFSSNADIHSIGLKTAPNIDIGIGKWTGMSGYINHYGLREPGAYGATSSDFGTELAVYAEFQLFENLYLSPLWSHMFIGKAYEQQYNKFDDVDNFQIMGILTY